MMKKNGVQESSAPDMRVEGLCEAFNNITQGGRRPPSKLRLH